MKRAALYSRVSTLEQANNGYSLNAQKEQLTNYAKAMNYQIAGHYSDGGHSGGNIDRPEIKRLINDIESKEIDVVIVVKLDRLSRNQRNTLYLIEDVFNKSEVGFISLQESFDTTTTFGRAMIGIISTFAQLERDTIYERMFMGRKERAKSGLYRGSSNVATGYTYTDGKLFVNDDADIVRDIFTSYVDGESASAIFTRLAREYGERIYGHNMIVRILENPIYIGKVKFDGEYYDGIHDPIISNDLFEAAQEKRRQVSSRYQVDWTKRTALLARKIFCGHCGKTFVRHRFYRYRNGKTYQAPDHRGYYVCNGSKSRTYVKTGNRCLQGNKLVEVIDDIVLDRINSLDFEKAKHAIEGKRKVNTSKKRIDELDQQQKRLMDLYQLGSVDVNELDERLKKINEERKKIKETKSSLAEKKVMKQLESLQGVDIYSLSFEKQCFAVDTLIDNIVIKDDDITINLNL